MIWKKKLLLLLLVVSSSLLLSVFGFEIPVSAANRNVTTLSDSVSSYTVVSGSTGGLFERTTNVSDGTATRFFHLNFGLNNTITSSNTNGVHVQFYVLVNGYPDYAGYQLIAPGCPVDYAPSGYWSVKDCTAEFIEWETFVTRWQYRENSQVQGNDSIITDQIQSTYVLHYDFIAYYGRDDSVTTNTFKTYGPYLAFFNDDGATRRFDYTVLFANYVSNVPINVPTAEDKMNDKDDQDRADLENQSSDTSDSADEQGAEASETGTTLLGVFSAFVSALATIHETNCRLPSMTVYGMELGQMDLCTFDVPPGIIALATVGMVFIIVPLSFNLARRLVNLFRSFQG